MNELKFLSVTGNLGYGFNQSSLNEGKKRNPNMIGADNGSTDPGPYYLGSGEQLTREGQVKRDLSYSLAAARDIGVPYVIGSAGTGGGKAHVNAFLKILYEIVKEENYNFKLACINAEIDRNIIKQAIKKGKVKPYGKIPQLTEKMVDDASCIVGQMGVGPFMKAYDKNADVIIAGRSCDTAIYASLAAYKGFDLGLAFHMAKIIECGAQCAIPLAANDCILGTLRSDHFELEPMNKMQKLTPTSVAAHMMYEQPDPYLLYEPEGLVNLKDTEIVSISDNRVRVTGSNFTQSKNPTIKLEGAELCGYRAITVAGMTDPRLISKINYIEEKVKKEVEFLSDSFVDKKDYQLRFINYGLNSVSLSNQIKQNDPKEVGLVIEAIAPNQEIANTILSLARSSYLHCDFEGRIATAGNLAFPFSPSDFQGGPVFKFSVYHLMEVDDIDSIFDITVSNVNERVFI